MYEREIQSIKNGDVGIMPTDTIYGIACSALNPAAVKRVYALKGRDTTKPPIVLISSKETLTLFGIRREEFEAEFAKYWPGPTTLVLPCADERFSYLHRGTGGIAFRLPAPVWLSEFLKGSGPVIAPSAIPQGLSPARNVAEAKSYFGDRVDFYIDRGETMGKPSSILSLLPHEWGRVIRA